MSADRQRPYGGWRGELLPRLPVLLLCAAILGLFVGWPYAGLDADATTFGIMGNDLLRRGYLPTLTYGQNYLFSFTPYTYALFRALWPGMAPALAFALGGAVFSLGGLWLIAEALLTVLRRQRVAPALPLSLFCAAIACSRVYVTDIQVNSGIETSLFLTGLVFFAAARLHAAAGSAAEEKRAGAWFALGAAVSVACYTRPQVVLYALAPLAALLTDRRRRAGWVGMARSAAAAGWGALAGALPILLHVCFRARTWPFKHHVPLRMGSLSDLAGSLSRLFQMVLGSLFGFDYSHGLFAVLTLIWITAALAAFLLRVRADPRGEPRGVTALDVGWAAGSIAMLAIMVATPNLLINTTGRRYCLQTLPAVAWLFARFAPGLGRRKGVARLLVAALAVAALPAWSEKLRDLRAKDQSMRDAVSRFLPELMAQDAVILTDYWDAYLLAFLADGHARIEAYPWQLVRTYGWVGERDMRRRTLWLIACGHGHDTYAQLVEELGTNVMRRCRSRDTKTPLLGRVCELWDLGDGDSAAGMMRKYHPRYFQTAYPPGSARGGAR